MTDLLGSVYEKYRSQNRMYAAIVELTYRCACRCVHCYIDDYGGPELSTDEVVDLLHQLAEEGVFNLSLTGGEVFLRRDLETIIREASRLGFFIMLLTTGIFINEDAADMIRRHKVHSVEMSIMGATAATHDAVMRRPGAFDKAIRAVRLLRERGVTVVLKNSVLADNVSELEAMAGLAASLGCAFAASLTVLPKTDGDAGPQSHAVDFATASRLKPEWLTGGLIPGEDALPGAMLTCNAGKTNCGISPDGDVYPCLIWRRPVGNIRKRSLRSIWHDHPDLYLERVRKIRPEDSVECFACDYRKSCRRCPGAAFSETGDYRLPIASACRLAGKTRNCNFDPL